MERIDVSRPQTVSLENGVIIDIKKKKEKIRPTPSEVALHETDHILVEGEIVEASINLTADSEGHTIPVRGTAAGAAAAAARGRSGVGWDTMLVVYKYGQDMHSAMAAANAKLSGLEEEHLEVATRLEEERVIGQREVDESIQRVEDKRNGIHDVEMRVIYPGGREESFKLKSLRNQVAIETKILRFPKQDTQKKAA